jgi:hypothetical protein
MAYYYNYFQGLVDCWEEILLVFKERKFVVSSIVSQHDMQRAVRIT